MYPRNSATPPRIAIGAVIQISDGAVQSSGVSVVVRPEGGSETAGSGTVSYGGSSNVVYYAPTQAETNYTAFVVTAYKTGCIPVSKTVITTESATAGRAYLAAGDVSGNLPANIKAISDDTTAADNLEAAADGTGYNLGGGQVMAASVTGAVASVTGNVGGNVTGSVGSVANGGITSASFGAGAINAAAIGTGALTSAKFAAGAITASAIATDAIGSDQIAASAVSEIQSGLATSANQATIIGYLDTEIAAIIAALTTADGKLDSILEDTGTTLPDLFPANFAALGINASGHLSRVTLVDTTTTNTDMRGTDGAYTGTPPTASTIRQEIDSNSTKLAAIVADTNELQTDWADGGRLDLLLDQLIAYFTTARGEPAQGAPPASAVPLVKLDYLYKIMRNKSDQSETEQRIYADDGSTVDHKRSVSVSGGVVTLGEITSGP